MLRNLLMHDLAVHGLQVPTDQRLGGWVERDRSVDFRIMIVHRLFCCRLAECWFAFGTISLSIGVQGILASRALADDCGRGVYIAPTWFNTRLRKKFHRPRNLLLYDALMATCEQHPTDLGRRAGAVKLRSVQG